MFATIPNEANVYQSIDRKPRLVMVELIHANHNNGKFHNEFYIYKQFFG